MRKILFIICLLCTSLLHAQQEKQADVVRATLYGVGFSNILDTYLSPQEYTGIDFRISRESIRKSRWTNITQQTFFQSNLSYTQNSAENNNTLSVLANWNYALHYHFPITDNFKLLAGGLLDLNGGFVYNMRNGNNPAQARLYANIGASGMALWNVKIKNYPIALRYQINLPLMGVMFMPEYGQSYYEIFSLGNADGVVNFTSLHNQPALRQMLTADFPIGKARMRFAYVWDAQQAKVNDIKVHNYSHTFMIGFVKHFNIVK
ncbi:MAG: DUF3316 domain-containing protein [Mediterranea massiliensis]|nr:DUF3316 domain-containing protein [Mediterranea massiliensis]